MSEKKTVETFKVQALGCRVNQYDAQQIERLLEQYGLREAGKDEIADVVALHSCAVTATAVQKTRQSIRRMMRSNPGCFAFLTGCAASKDLVNELEGLSAKVAAGPDWLERFSEAVERLPLPSHDFHFSGESDSLLFPTFGEHTRAFLKIQDGCDIGCAYCIIPSLRKAPRDKPVAVAIAEAERLVKEGYREIVVTGVSVGLYGRDGEYSLCDVLRGIEKIAGVERIRMGSLHPEELTDDFLGLWASSPKFMPHFHLSLQSGCSATLKAMRRSYTAGEYRDAVERARMVLDNPAFTTDVIVGFPGETSDHFEESYEFCKAIGFSKMHVFPFSPRPGTAAAKMSDPVPGNVAQVRSERLGQLSDEMGAAYYSQFVGQTIPVLLEQQNRSGDWEGFSPHYVPVRISAGEAEKGDIRLVLVESVSSERAFGKFV
ncbi:tRNA (N(6)-L-threonylcarbamoyladenosine(37)-C(2))-methylthiotransferase MtaB [Verrucomicrobiota bacterium]